MTKLDFLKKHKFGGGQLPSLLGPHGYIPEGRNYYYCCLV